MKNLDESQANKLRELYALLEKSKQDIDRGTRHFNHRLQELCESENFLNRKIEAYNDAVSEVNNLLRQVDVSELSLLQFVDNAVEVDEVDPFVLDHQAIKNLLQ